MRIVCGARGLREADWLLSNGADEVYCGLTCIPNHRPDILSIWDEDEFLKIIDLAHKKGKKTLLLINGSCDPKGYELLAQKAAKFAGHGADGLVISEFPVLEHLNARRVPCDYILSSLALVFNSLTLDYLARLNVKRIILPCHLPPREGLGIIRNGHGMETEMFYYPAHYCQNVDPLCKFCGMSANYSHCKLRFEAGDARFRMPTPDARQMADIMYDGYKAGVGYLKISRRLDFGLEKALLRDALGLSALLESGVPRERFRVRHAKVCHAGGL